MTMSPSVASQGTTVNVSLTLTNNGATTVKAAGAGVSFGEALQVSPSIGPCAGSFGTASCGFGPLAPGESATATFGGTALTPGSYNLIAAAPGGPTAQAPLTVLPSSADLSVALSGPAIRPRGSYVDYTLTVRNNGPANAAAVRVNFEVPPGGYVYFDCERQSLPCLLGTLAPGVPRVFYVAFYLPSDFTAPDPFVAKASVSAANFDPVTGNNVATVSTRIDTPTTQLKFFTLTPCRLIDTRDPARGGPLPRSSGAATYTADAGGCGISSEARALAVNVTVTQPEDSGHLKIYPPDGATGTSVVNYSAGQTRANNAVIGIDVLSRFVIEVTQASGATHVIVDVVGYFQ
jgi:hypothetical protein